MITLRADLVWPELLGALTEPVEIVDADGAVLGRFMPDPVRIKQFYGRADHLPSAAEIERQLTAVGPSCTTRQLFEHLLTLTSDPTERAHLEELIKKRAAEEDGCPSQ
jgi:hypothetical protein